MTHHYKETEIMGDNLFVFFCMLFPLDSEMEPLTADWLDELDSKPGL